MDIYDVYQAIRDHNYDVVKHYLEHQWPMEQEKHPDRVFYMLKEAVADNYLILINLLLKYTRPDPPIDDDDYDADYNNDILFSASYDAMKLLLEAGADPNRNPNLLNSLVYHNDYDMIKLLLNYGADINMGTMFEYPLFVAVKNNDYDMIDFLLQHNADPNILNIYDESAYDIAVKNGNISIINLMDNYKNGIFGIKEPAQ
jgi:ankyrin repeat protein